MFLYRWVLLTMCDARFLDCVIICSKKQAVKSIMVVVMMNHVGFIQMLTHCFSFLGILCEALTRVDVNWEQYFSFFSNIRRKYEGWGENEKNRHEKTRAK